MMICQANTCTRFWRGIVPETPEFWFANRACASTDRPDPEVDFGSSDTVSVMGDQESAPVDRDVVPPEPIVREPAPVMDAQSEPIVIRAGPAWLSAARYEQTRHGPRNVDTLQETTLKITAGRHQIDSSREKGIWTFDFVKRQCLCQGCRGSMAKGTLRLGWYPKTVHREELRSLPGFHGGFWHLACAILTSKVPARRNCLKETDLRVVGLLSGAPPADALS